MVSARRILMAGSWLYVLGIAIQFFLAGIGTLGGEGMSAHEGFGYSALHFTPVLLLVAAWFARVPFRLLIATVVFAAVALVQPIWVTEFRGELLASLHILGALVIFALAHSVAQRATALLKETRSAGRPE